MQFRAAGECTRPVFFQNARTGFAHQRPGPLRKGFAEFRRQLLHAAQELFPREDARRRDRNVALRLGPLLHTDLFAARHQRPLDQRLVGELVRQHPRALRHLFEQVLDHPGVSPSEQPVQVADLVVEAVVGLRRQVHHRILIARDLPDSLRQLQNLLRAFDQLGVATAKLTQLRAGFGVGVDSGDAQRPEEVPLAALVDAAVRLDRFVSRIGVQPECESVQDLRLQNETHEILRAAALHRQFAGVVDRHIDLVADRLVAGVLKLTELPAAPVEQFPERVRLLRRDGAHVAGHFLTGHIRPPPESSARRARPRWSRRRHRRGSPPPAVPAPAA